MGRGARRLQVHLLSSRLGNALRLSGSSRGAKALTPARHLGSPRDVLGISHPFSTVVARRVEVEDATADGCS